MCQVCHAAIASTAVIAPRQAARNARRQHVLAGRVERDQGDNPEVEAARTRQIPGDPERATTTSRPVRRAGTA
jgi:hypothetical protein